MSISNNATKSERVNRLYDDQTTKVEAYNWSTLDLPGSFKMIHKSKLNIDHQYQRTEIANSRVLQIAREWSWAAFGVLLVALRRDGSMWVFDGQHRKLAADKRADIQDLPCLVFELVDADKAMEAISYLRANTCRGPMRAIQKFKAQVLAGDKGALEAKDLIESTGYEASASKIKFTCTCVSRIMSSIASCKESARVAWTLVCEMFDGEPIHEAVFTGLFGTERMMRKKKLGSIASAQNRAALLRLGWKAVLKSIQETVAFMGYGGEKAYCEGVVRLLNKGRRNRIPSSYENEVQEPEVTS